MAKQRQEEQRQRNKDNLERAERKEWKERQQEIKRRRLAIREAIERELMG